MICFIRGYYDLEKKNIENYGIGVLVDPLKKERNKQKIIPSWEDGI